MGRIRAEEQRTRLLPVVILTSSEDQEDVVKGYGLGANSFVRKPVEMGRFCEAVVELGMYWIVLNETPSGSGGAARGPSHLREP